MARRLSALDIPEELPPSLRLAQRVRENHFFTGLVADHDNNKSETLTSWIAQDLQIDAEVVREIVKQTVDNQFEASPVLDLKDGEWAAFLKKFLRERDSEQSDFVVDTWGRGTLDPGSTESLLGVLDGVGQVRRVREVRALTGFQRYSYEADIIPVDLGPDAESNPIYPAVEYYGEGIFLRFNEDMVASWESNPAVQERAAILARRYSDVPSMKNIEFPEPRYLALHTLAHLLIRQLAFASGYSAASLQERIYANSSRPDKTAGILIYTAAGDAQGTLGGLVRLGSQESLVPLMLQALESADFCSNDPVCIESDSQGAAMMNLSACHGCALISETSCESQNRLLDRQLVMGGDGVPGLLGGLLEVARQQRFRA